LIKELESFIDGYLLWTRIAYQALAEIVRPTSNLILEWNQSPEALALAIIEGLKEQNFL